MKLAARASTGNDIHDEILRLSDELTEAIEELVRSGRDFAVKDNEMRKAKAKAFLQSFGKNAQEREANADSKYADERLEATIAEHYNTACLEKVRGIRAQLSALQTLAAARRAEAESIGFGQTQRV